MCVCGEGRGAYSIFSGTTQSKRIRIKVMSTKYPFHGYLFSLVKFQAETTELQKLSSTHVGLYRNANEKR